MEHQTNSRIINLKLQKLTKLSIPTPEGFTFIDTEDILYLQAEGNYTQVHLQDKTRIVSSKTLGYYENELVAEPFIRIHNSTIVNLNRIKSYVKGDDGWVILQNGISLKVSKSRKDILLLFFQGRKASQ